ncbi:hypothetical protein Tco_0044647 [Tanacetum coccineum]
MFTIKINVYKLLDLATIVEEETTIMYGIMEDAQDDRSQLTGRVNMLYRDRPVYRRLAVMIEREAKMAREAWGLSMDASDYACLDVMSLRTTLVAQSALISELQSADHRRQRMVELQRQHGPAKGPAQPDAPFWSDETSKVHKDEDIHQMDIISFINVDVLTEDLENLIASGLSSNVMR